MTAETRLLGGRDCPKDEKATALLLTAANGTITSLNHYLLYGSTLSAGTLLKCL